MLSGIIDCAILEKPIPASIVCGKYLITDSSGSSTNIISHGAVYQENGIIVDVGPVEKLNLSMFTIALFKYATD